MHKFLKTYREKCLGCNACQEACSTLFFKENDPQKSCIQISEADGGFDIKVCNQCGKCINLCPAGAITRNAAGIITINKKTCSGCLICVAECPTGAMMYHSYEPYPYKCIVCGKCVSQCPANAIAVEKG